MAERQRPVRKYAVGVGSARRHCAGHPDYGPDIGCLPVEADLTADTAHISCFREFSTAATEDERDQALLDGDRLGQVPWLVDVVPTGLRYRGSEHLQRNRRQQRLEKR